MVEQSWAISFIVVEFCGIAYFLSFIVKTARFYIMPLSFKKYDSTPIRVGLSMTLCFCDMTLFEQKGTKGVSGGLHPCPRFGIEQIIGKEDGLAQVLKGFFVVAFAVFDLAVQHFGGNCLNLKAGRYYYRRCASLARWRRR
jgi:hypothetical protein